MKNNTAYLEIQKSLRSRWRAAWSNDAQFCQLDRAFKTTLSALDSLITKKSELEASKKFSYQGLMEEARVIAQREAVPALKEVSDTLENVRSQLSVRRNAASGPQPDPTDAVGAVLRGEMRTWMRSLPHADVMQVLLKDDADERLLMAVLEVPASMSGITDQMLAIVQTHVAEKLHGPELAKIEEMNEAIVVTGSALEIAVFQMRREIGFSESATVQFNMWMNDATAQIALEANRETTSTGSQLLESLMADTKTDIDEIFAKAFPAMYPTHPVNTSVQSQK